MPGVAGVRNWIFGGPRSHDELYGDEYFEMVERTTAVSVDAIARSIVSSLAPGRVIDVGCGTGTVLARLRDLGVDGVGLEYARAGIDACRERGLEVHRFDVVTDSLPATMGAFDVALSMEVGQQLPPGASDRYVDLLASLAPVLVFSSGVPGQGDRAPQNEQPHRFWIGKFSDRELELDRDITRQWRTEWAAASVAPWFASNVMVFRR